MASAGIPGEYERVKPYYRDDSVVIYHADCLDLLFALRSKPIDLVLTDPPYGIAHPTNYASRGRGTLAQSRDYPPVYGDDQPFDPKPILAVGKSHILWGANYYANKLPPMSGWLVWDKERPDTIDQATCELAWTDCVRGVRRLRHLWHGMMRASREKLVHPTQKPDVLMRWCLSLVPDAKVILDPYMGSGSTLYAAKNLGRKAIGIEIEEKYCFLAAKRMEQTTLGLYDGE